MEKLPVERQIQAVYGFELFEKSDIPWSHDGNLDEAYYFFAPDDVVGRIPCFECDCTGWYAPDNFTSERCNACKGTGRLYVGLI